MSLVFVHLCFPAAPHIRKKPSLPSKPSAEGQTRQIYRQSRDDDRSELKIFLFCSHPVSLNDSKILAKFTGSGERSRLKWAQPSSFSQAHAEIVFTQPHVRADVHRNQADTPADIHFTPRKTQAPTLRVFLACQQCPEQGAQRLLVPAAQWGVPGQQRNASRGDKGRERALPCGGSPRSMASRFLVL